ncbi:NTP/NDP exchange transporter [Seonamhaeicola maritimus]|uniref:MFS transporter n=1 Tax=Seonamhaeicola maritimus TaxID=2591822 RepID=A0A5C7GFR0_9FLAO|nr:MFS transporter [Seonamhaeicola maritimus]TXG35903.1 MFS transporter [Seonamhaeicola maritimus]
MIKKLLKKASEIEAHEIKATALSFLFVFILMLAYYILRPVRDAMASDWSDAEVSQLWTLNFFISTGVVAFYGLAVSKMKFKLLVPSVYAFFAVTFILFYSFMSSITDSTLVDKCFYVWLSVFAMFHLSVFWSFMSDVFNKDQARRLFATIAAGASAGALLGPMIPTLFAGVGTDNLILVAAVLLLIPIPVILTLTKLKTSELKNEDETTDTSKYKIGGNPFAGFKSFVTNPYLLAIGVFILLYTMISTFVYFEQKNLLAEFDRAKRTQILGSIDWIVNVLTFGVAFFATSRIVKKMGMGYTLALMPIIVCVGILILAFAPIIVVLLALQVARRAGNYAVTKPAREMLFTEVDKETRFKAKPVIDVVVYRGGDMATAWIFTGLTEGLGLGFTAVGIIGGGIAAVWAGVGLWMGKLYNRQRAIK